MGKDKEAPLTSNLKLVTLIKQENLQIFPLKVKCVSVNKNALYQNQPCILELLHCSKYIRSSLSANSTTAVSTPAKTFQKIFNYIPQIYLLFIKYKLH